MYNIVSYFLVVFKENHHISVSKVFWVCDGGNYRRETIENGSNFLISYDKGKHKFMYCPDVGSLNPGERSGTK